MNADLLTLIVRVCMLLIDAAVLGAVAVYLWRAHRRGLARVRAAARS